MIRKFISQDLRANKYKLTCPIGCGLAGVCGFELKGGVIGCGNRRPPPSRGLCGARWLKKGDEPPTEPGPPCCCSSIAIGDGGLSSSECDLCRYTADSSTYLDRSPLRPCVGVKSSTTFRFAKRLWAPSRIETKPPPLSLISRQYIAW